MQEHNLKQLGLALHNYHETANTLPPGWVSANLFGWNTMVLPNLDSSSSILYSRFTFAKAWTEDQQDQVTIFSNFHCPSDTGTDLVGPPVLSVSVARSNYPGVSGATLISNVTIDVKQTHGTFGENSSRRFKEFKDGLNNVVVIGERKSAGGRADNPGGDTIWVGVRDNHTQQGQALVVGDCAQTNPPNFKQSSKTAAAGGNITGFSSFHVGGTHFLLGDGSVRYLSERIDSNTYSNLATVDDGAELGD